MPTANNTRQRWPLFGRTVAVTRPVDQAADLGGPLRAVGAEVIDAPMIEVASVEDYGPMDGALHELTRYDWLVLTSTNGVAALFDRLGHLGWDSRRLAGVRVAAVGSATEAALASYGIRADLVPGQAVGEALADALIARGVAGKRVLILRAERARPTLPQMLTRAGAEVSDVAAYRTLAPARLPPVFIEKLEGGRLDWVTLTSPSAFENLLELLGPQRISRLERVKLASIGPVTSRAIRAAGFRVHAEANPHDVGGVVAALVAAERAGPGGQDGV